MPMTFNLSDRTLRCVANVAHSNFSDVNSSVVIAFSKCELFTVLQCTHSFTYCYNQTMREQIKLSCAVDGPKFINCAGVELRRRLYEQAVSVDCDIQAKPVVDAVTVHWSQSPTRNVSLSAGHRDGHCVVLLQSTNTSVRR